MLLLACGSTPPPTCVEHDADCDGYPDWSTTSDPELADCDDGDASVNPTNERLVPAGEFLRGDSNQRDAQPARKLHLKAFCVERYEVRNAHYVDFLKANPDNGASLGQLWFDVEDADDEFQNDLVSGLAGWRVRWGREDFPVTEVTLDGAHAYCAWRGMRVPTEAEWEKAARGTDGRSYPWGETHPTCELANFGGDGPSSPPCHGEIVEVGSYPLGASPYGALDMAGNVSEWVSDWYDAEYYHRAPGQSPPGPESGKAFFPEGERPARVTRGGAALGLSNQLHVSARFPEPVGATSNGIGLRCVRPL